MANKYLSIAAKLTESKNLSICNNLAVSFSLRNLNKEACQLYTTILEKEPINETIYNKALASVELGCTDISSLIEQIHESASYMSSIDNIDLSVLYYLSNDYPSSYQCLMENCNFSLLDWKSLSFVLYRYNRTKFEELKQDAVCQRELWKEDLYDNVDDEGCGEVEVASLNNEIQELENLECCLECPPAVNAKELYHTLPIGCMLFDCKVCNAPPCAGTSCRRRTRISKRQDRPLGEGGTGYEPGNQPGPDRNAVRKKAPEILRPAVRRRETLL